MSNTSTGRLKPNYYACKTTFPVTGRPDTPSEVDVNELEPVPDKYPADRTTPNVSLSRSLEQLHLAGIGAGGG